MKVRRRSFLGGSAMTLGALSCADKKCPDITAGPGRVASSDEEYVWVSANANLPLFVAHDHPALQEAGRELGVRVTIAGPNTVDIPGLVAAVEQVAARKPAGMMVVGWEPSALISPIDAAIAAGVPVVCVDSDVPASKRMAFIGTDWFDLGVRQAQAMVKALGNKRGKVALLGLIEQEINQRAFTGFRSVAEKVGLTCLPPQQDKGSIAEAARVTAGLLQAHPDLAGIAGFDSESGPGIGQAVKEANKNGQVVCTAVEAEPQHLQLVNEGALTAVVGQKRALFTYYGMRVLYDIVHAKVRFTGNDRALGVLPAPTTVNTGTFTVTRENVAALL